jgi:succinyl-diaminopimelate desuccinylase
VPDELVKANGMISATNLVVRKRFGAGGPVIALNAHGDVVPPGEGWTRDPFGAEIVDGWMLGRGVAVSKSDFATYAYALLALQAAEKAGARLQGAVELHLTYDEEAGGEIGPGWLLREGISRPDLALSAGFSYGVVTAHNGCLHLEVQVDGRSAHAAMPWTGVDALEAAIAILTALYDWRKGLTKRVSKIEGIGSPQLTVGLIKGGINTNVVPDRVTFRLDRRMIPEEQPEEAEAELRHVIEAAGPGLPGSQGERPAHPPGRAAGAAAGQRAAERGLVPACHRNHGRARPAQGRAALHRHPALRRRGRAGRPLRGRPAHDRGGQRAPRRRAPAARRPSQGHRGRSADPA